MYRLYTPTVFVLCLLVPIFGLAQESEQDVDLNAKCDFLKDLYIKDTNILSVSIIPAIGDFPEYCRILGYVRPAINFEIRLPTKNWNGNFYMAGCGGFCGGININATNKALLRNYVVSSTDAGHWGKNVLDIRWAYNNRLAEIDWAYRAVHETAVVTKKVIKAFFAREVDHSYFEGCSNGGRDAIMSAGKYPDDFDGLISGMPTIDQTGLITHYNYMIQSNVGHDGKDIIKADDLKMIISAVYEACDEVDGLKDGLIDTPGACQFDPATLLCSENKSTDCLTNTQVETLKFWYAGAKNSAGEQLYPGGLPLGSEPFWQNRITGYTDSHDDGLVARICIEVLRYLAFQEDPGEKYTLMDFDFDEDPKRMEFMAQIYNAESSNLESFRAQGGKLLMYQSWADPTTTPWRTIAYYEAVEEKVGSHEETLEFFRLFMIPGMDHCGYLDGPGIDSKDGFDPLTALEKWIKEDDPPESILTTKYDDDGNVLWTRPVCPYPKSAIYDGQGDIHDAANYICSKPKH